MGLFRLSPIHSQRHATCSTHMLIQIKPPSTRYTLLELLPRLLHLLLSNERLLVLLRPWSVQTFTNSFATPCNMLHLPLSNERLPVLLRPWGLFGLSPIHSQRHAACSTNILLIQIKPY